MLVAKIMKKENSYVKRYLDCLTNWDRELLLQQPKISTICPIYKKETILIVVIIKNVKRVMEWKLDGWIIRLKRKWIDDAERDLMAEGVVN